MSKFFVDFEGFTMFDKSVVWLLWLVLLFSYGKSDKLFPFVCLKTTTPIFVIEYNDNNNLLIEVVWVEFAYFY